MQIGPLNTTIAAPPVDPTATAKDSPELQRQVVSAVRALNKSEMFGQDRELRFTRDPDTRKMVIKVVQQGTGEVVDQIPPEQVLHAAAMLDQLGKGAVQK